MNNMKTSELPLKCLDVLLGEAVASRIQFQSGKIWQHRLSVQQNKAALKSRATIKGVLFVGEFSRKKIEVPLVRRSKQSATINLEANPRISQFVCAILLSRLSPRRVLLNIIMPIVLFSDGEIWGERETEINWAEAALQRRQMFRKNVKTDAAEQMIYLLLSNWFNNKFYSLHIRGGFRIGRRNGWRTAMIAFVGYLYVNLPSAEVNGKSCFVWSRNICTALQQRIDSAKT